MIVFNKSFLLGVFIISCGYLLIKYNTKINSINELKGLLLNLLSISASISSEKLFTIKELEKYTGENGGPIYLSILGNVFDVTKGKKHYAKGETYSIFAGRDASKAFVTGDFSMEGLTDDVSDLTLNEFGDLNDWLKTYKKDYIYKGKLIGRFYDNNGKPTNFLRGIEEKMKLLSSMKKEADDYKNRFPPCNVEWTPESGSRFWCSNQSGGISRSWVGVPRKFYQPGSTHYRCACVNSDQLTEGKFLPYEGCPLDSVACIVNLKDD